MRLLIADVAILLAFIVLFFFFSSRRRHTRLVSDWSSDVCSSDLAAFGEVQRDVGDGVLGRGAQHHAPRHAEQLHLRSEEHTSELQSLTNLVCRLLLEKKKKKDQSPY